LANNSSYPRPILVYTFAKAGHRDFLNFPARSIHDEKEEEVEEDEEEEEMKMKMKR
jgi:hypothetical protein